MRVQPAPFPLSRPRRLRRTRVLRELARETRLSRRDLVAPLFVKEGIGEPLPISSMPGHHQHTLESLRKEAAELAALGVPALLLFGVPAHKDAEGSQAWAPDGIVQRALRALAADLGDEVALVGDLCLCEYTDHGHCGLLQDGGAVANDATLERYARIAVAQAEAGAAVIAPSGMMDGQVGAIRSALDDAGFADTAILAYAAKYASGLYGPFREAAEGAPRFGDRTGYQMDPANADEALREVALDVAEGADLVMVKPAGAYLDVLWRVKQAFGLPTAAYHVSGEYAMVKAAAERGWVDGERVMLELLCGIRRAGADLVVTYFARDAAPLL
jgi:porphobilinogen synthase